MVGCCQGLNLGRGEFALTRVRTVLVGFAQPAPEAALDTLAGLVSSNSNFSILLAAAKVRVIRPFSSLSSEGAGSCPVGLNAG